jgi:uracil-DNA glycosylase
MWLDDLKTFPPTEWEDLIQECDEDLTEIASTLADFKCIEPHPSHFFHPYYLTPKSNVRVVIVFYRPLEGNIYGTMETKSQGLGSSVRRNDIIPYSTQNIYKELQRSNINFEPPSHGDLTSWTRRGVFLMTLAMSNCSGTKLDHHMKLWAIIIRRTCE